MWKDTEYFEPTDDYCGIFTIVKPTCKTGIDEEKDSLIDKFERVQLPKKGTLALFTTYKGAGNKRVKKSFYGMVTSCTEKLIVVKKSKSGCPISFSKNDFYVGDVSFTVCKLNHNIG